MTFQPGSGYSQLPEQPAGQVPELSVPSPARGTTGILNVLLITAAGIVLVLVGLFLFATLGSEAFILCGVLALIPLGICLLGLHWIDRWEPEPRGALVFAFLWGAGVSVAITLLLGGAVNEVLVVLLPLTPADVITTVIQAPLVEEAAKGLGVLLLVFVRRSHFDGPLDGIVYAGVVGAGFAFTENILYFSAALFEAGGVGLQLGFVFVLRGLFSPFAHVLFTAAIGLSLGIAVRKPGAWRIVVGFLAGLAAAVAGHMFWNGGMALVADDFFVFYFLLQVPLFALAVGGVTWLRRQEQRLTRQRLGEYAAAGWFTPAEVNLLSTPAGRRRALHWAGAFGAKAPMRTFIREATHLALTRQQLVNGRDLEKNLQREHLLLAALTRTRTSLLSVTAAGRRY
ncbi:PrsW family intramembrane metalloprotease [Arthrobacter sp. BL-252-APC-1A]|uniref:PrsW family intramembrane metalloprotease n=1 Tax=Arthrobacter sp. BL-252-APC-1A TaxID=2606622 RepID=UPI0012B35848|nr:PrsW family intramembrane metalloprotease [Arthrobacter sp. BL-252-APC-1A]MSR97713.1 PrsW family intramembrane metalloprotease [Arthrobacter sp. BL-252-APC-1A]